MNTRAMRIGFGLMGVFAAQGVAGAARAEVVSIQGHTRAEVRQLENGVAVQSDAAQEGLDLAASPSQALSAASLQAIQLNGIDVAGGAALSILRPQSRGVLGLPNDVGLDISVFSIEPSIHWEASGEAVETRSILLTPAEVGAGAASGELVEFRSRLVLAGTLLVLSTEIGEDLTGTDVGVTFSVVRRGGTLPDATLIEGKATLSGGMNGRLSVESGGVLGNRLLPIVRVPSSVPGLPTVRLVVFPGLQLTYEYEAILGQTFMLELVVGAHTRTSRGWIGTAAVFGLPVEGLPEIIGRTRRDDSGARLSAIIAEQVDTTGRRYQSGGADGGSASGGGCGAAGPEMLLLAPVGWCVVGVRRLTPRCRR